MGKERLAEEARKELLALLEEEAKGGFNEYAQFCEEWLRDNIEFLTREGIRKLIKDTTEAQQLRDGKEPYKLPSMWKKIEYCANGCCEEEVYQDGVCYDCYIRQRM